MSDEATAPTGAMPESPGPEASGYDAPTLSDDFLQGDVRHGLERMRLRLLDLTGRNRLLNFKTSKRTSLRVVDEIPDQLFTQLVHGHELHFAPVPRPRGIPRPGSRDEEMEGRNGQRLLGEALQHGRYPSAKEHAETLGIATSFDLPRVPENGSGARRGRHADRAIQTLHYPEELETKLRSTSSAARLAVEETGSNMLYLAFGFLEWFESRESSQMRSAPLILLPVNLRRGPADERTRTIRYLVGFSGEDIQANVSLQERLRRDFNLDVPGFAEDDTPESYFAKLGPLLKKDDRWRLRRHLTLTLLAFGKLLMYRDLDPSHWPQGKGPADHPRINEFFKGVQREGITFASEYPLDDPKMRGRVPPVVDDVDSSQHSALVDAMDGKNLVIEGPPGTGKSQTITNLIAAALVAGKSVLFVSEKLAALQVVRDRLDNLGIGEFCLELHSHKAQKGALLDDIRARIDTLRKHRGPRLLDEKLQLLDEDKKQLTDYAELINRPFGRLGESLHDIIWSAQRRRRDLSFDPSVVKEILLPGAQNMSPDDLEQRRQLVAQFAMHLQVVSPGDESVREHPWSGLRATHLTFMDEREIVEKLTSVWQSAKRLEELVDEQSSVVGDWLGHSLSDIGSGVSAALKLPREATNIIPSLLQKLKDPSLSKRIIEFCHSISQFNTILDSIRRLLGTVPEIDPEGMARAHALLEQGSALATGVVTLSDLAKVASLFTEASEKLRHAEAAQREALAWLEAEAPFTRDSVSTTKAALTSVKRCQVDDLHYRHSGLTHDSVFSVLEKAGAEAAYLRNQRSRLSRDLDLRLLPHPVDLRRFVAATANVRWWSFLYKDYRAARRAHSGMMRVAGRVRPDRLRAEYRKLLDYSDQVGRFRGNRSYQELGASFFDGIETPFDALRRLVDWRIASQAALSREGRDGRLIFAKLWEAPAEQIRGLKEADGESERLTTSLTVAQDTLVEASPHLVHDDVPDVHTDLAQLSRELEEAGVELGAVAAQLQELGFPQAARLADIPVALRLLGELQSVRTMIVSDRVIEKVLGEHFAGVDTHLEPVARTVEFYHTVVSSAAPELLKRWVLDPAVSERLSKVYELCATIDSRIKEYGTRWAQFAELGSVEWSKWAGEQVPLEDFPVEAAATRAERALDSRESLAAWLDYLRAAEAVTNAGLAELVQLAENGLLGASDLSPAFAFIASNSMVQDAFRNHKNLARFSGLTHDQVRSHYAQLDRETIKLYRARAAQSIDRRDVPVGNGYGPVNSYTELSLLEHEIVKQSRHIPVRQLMRRAGRALQALKPCFMMGPLSVAQYLEPGAIEFDIVVMDEASQLRPEDALGAIARARQVVIVGDRMQLPPTSFFDRIGEAELDDEEAADADGMTDAESILDVAAATYRPARLLRWHYRSRHASLIAFSNKEFYKGHLIAFPSPAPKSRTLGVKFIHVKDGVYENGRNLVEAERAVETAIRHMRMRPDESLGIVTMNSAQRDLMEGIFEQKLKSDPAAQRYVAARETGLEPFFIKNLENVQGDERDVIYISVTYGRAATGKVYQRFGPINSATGHRRLNVLFTRARKRVVLFASMLAEDVLLQPNSSWGVRALKGYLHYAQTGILEQASHTGRDPDSDFEIEVAEALRSRGFEVAAQVGVAGYFIDLAVKHPGKTDAFLLGIECDGATYHSSVCARDRDRLRQSVLEDLGWSIHRIWSTDWFKQPGQEVARIVARIEELQKQERLRGGDADSLDPELEAYATPDTVAGAGTVLDGLLDAGWEDEVASQPLSMDEVRAELLRLREQMRRDHPATGEGGEVLRDELLESFLNHRPRDKQEWLTRIPLDLRIDTNGEQLKAYLESVLEITGRIAR